MRQLIFLEPAQQEFEDAEERYEALEPGLGLEFAEEVYQCLDRICLNPESYPLVDTRVRRYITQRFPYEIMYQIDGDRIVVYAIFHERRSPEIWRGRI